MIPLHQTVRIKKNKEIGIVTEISKDGYPLLYFVSGYKGTRDWFFSEDLEMATIRY